MNQLLLPRFKRLMEPASWRDLSVGQAWGAVSGLCHGFALLTLLPAASALATGMPLWGLSFSGWLIALAVIAVLGVGTEFYGMRTGYIGALGFIHDVHQAVGNKVARLPLGVFDSGSSGRLSRMVTQEMMN
ncbi:MAG: ABC transporter ATP-binding protein, partial [Actinomyces sp.]|nr:ABC transporter ATP-binding protein [Actinomyces sp.]